MRALKTYLVSGLLLFLLPSCEWIFGHGHCDSSGPIVVYKTKQDYSNNVFVQLSRDGTRVIAYPGPLDAIGQKPVELVDGYFLKRMVGNAVTSLTIDEYALSSAHYSSTDLFDLIIDKDPFLERYECCEYTNGDTAVINELIRTNHLDKCENIK